MPAPRVEPPPSRFRSVLVPVDFTAASQAAVSLAGSLASGPRARVHLLHVIERIEHLPERSTRAFYRGLEREALRRLAELVRALGADAVRGSQAIVFGRRAEEIVRFALDRRCDLIVMSSHRLDARSLPRGWASVSHQVAIFAQCPVLLLK